STSSGSTSSTPRAATASTTRESPAADPAGEEPERRALGRLACACPQEVEVTALVRLQHVLEVERAVAAPVLGLDRAELGEARGHLGRLHLEVEPLLLHVEHDRVAVP